MNYDNYQNYSLPTIRNEDWKYTDLSQLAKQGFSLINNRTKEVHDDAIKRVNAYIKQFCANSETIIVILDGVYSETTREVGRGLARWIWKS